MQTIPIACVSNKGLTAVGLVVFSLIHFLEEVRHGLIHSASCPVLITQRSVLGYAMPRVILELFREFELRCAVEGLSGNMH